MSPPHSPAEAPGLISCLGGGAPSLEHRCFRFLSRFRDSDVKTRSEGRGSDSVGRCSPCAGRGWGHRQGYNRAEPRCSRPRRRAAPSQPCPRVNLEKRTQEAGTEDMARRVGVVLAACEIIYRAAGWILERQREREREKTTKLLDSKLNENFLYLRKQMEPLKRVFKKLQEFKPSDLERLRADLEKIPGKEKEEIARALESRLQKKLKNLCRKTEDLEEYVHKWPESTKLDLERLRADLEKIPGKEEEEIARALESRLQKKLKNLCRKIEDLEDYVHKWPESTKLDLQLLSADLEKIHGNKEEEIARALESWMEKVFQHLSQIIQTPEEALQKRKGF
ncbi:PREDICTED: myosin-8-like isoform X3 [Corvus brachyrhynchos]|uniref:myosin-8-like isoform X3 n=1 Tax=Corvus brachyrhynchos TaxID=85066 RepID=UPI0008163441|nr:PREDICTED: myosin-8-like isoform X3 [Corvus brachyrhynchos]